jgi:hypothetical protein
MPARLIDAKLSDFGRPTTEPVLPAALYEARLARMLGRA